ncbi:MAG: hypothetical protein ABFS46_17440 [Myxococcota bacterium]
MLLAFAVRSLPVASAFPGDGSVILEIADGSYHARRALFTFVNFPSILFFDPYLNHPDGSPVPWPPLYDLALATVARLLGDSLAVFERTAAWASPALGALTVLPVYVAGRSLGGAGLALGAGSIFALLWAGAFQASVGNPDHHAAASLLGATLLAITLTLVHPDARGRHRVLLWLGWPLARAALVRPESRGAHTRDDNPEKDSEWGGVNLVIRKGADGSMQIRREPIPPMPAELSAIIEEQG